MADLQKPWPVRQMGGGSGSSRPYTVASGNSRIFLGDFVKLTAEGHVDVAAAGERILGLAAGTIAASTAGEIPVYDDPTLLFRIRADGAAAETTKGNLVDIKATTGNTDTNESKHEVDISEIGTVSRQLRIMDKMDTPGNDWGGTTIMLLCQIYEHELTQADQATPGV
ncbi:hypothetical protein LCGC14_1593160 [marine sediment metagenome]|uniref:Uncharacterized protein n=1 Tax=marine sediment metagenome TaxID=412755 RepID=A0A0F9LDW1_9ZZZZ